MKRYLPFIIIAIAVAGALAAGFWFYQTQAPEETTAKLTGDPFPEGYDNRSKGVVVVEEFGDYQCPPCGSLHPEMKKIKAEYGDRIRFIFRHFPLSQIHANARAAANAAVAAGKQGKFWEMHNLLYENQSAWSEAPDLTPIAVNFARQLGLDIARFAQDMNGNAVSAEVFGDYQRGISMGVTGTPTIFLDGQQLTNEQMTPEKLREEINKRLKG
ncbi:MAG: thioredoxin domain-containing protein [Acidobacteriota bacterium]|nr:MAG: thioredoxin domain-containing protein [Acidobacteriota bacterium]